jgi:diguanylate cyclase (GGDEF)-like protein
VSVAGLRFKSSRWLRASLQPATLLGLIMIAACWIGVVIELEMERGKTLDAAGQQSANLTRLFEENTVRTFEGVDRTLLLLREVYERDPAHFDLRDWSRRTALLGELTLMVALIGPDGYTIDRTEVSDRPSERTYLGDRDHFRAQVDAATDELFIGKPVIGRITGRRTIQISRRLRHPDGSFAGILAASLDPGFVEKFFETVDLGPQGSVVLRSRDGVILASSGLERASVGRTVLQSSLVEALARGPAGHYWGGGAVDGVNRLVSYRAASKYPLLVMLGISESTVFEGYGRSRLAYVTIASAVTMLILFAIAAGIRHQLRLDRIRDDLHHSEAQARDKAGQLERLAHHDALTGLANRNLLHERIRDAIERARDRQEGFAILSVDLDRFKTVNDTLGHSVGDELLRQIAERLNGCARRVDTVARIGGDEFVVLAGVNGPDGARGLATGIVERIGEPYQVSGSHLTIGSSIGIVLAPQDGMSVDRLLRNADLALYRAKASGRNGFCFFDSDIERAALARYRLECALPEALENDEFELFYQPWITLRSGDISGCEALLRWRHPVLGVIGPGEFVSVAEDIGLIGRIGEWVLRRACREAAAWPRPIKVAVNLSVAQFMTGDLCATVMAALSASGLPPQRLELEITESLLIEDHEGTLGSLHRLRDHGISIALDDFGTGYSSLTYLRQFPFDRIKIDQTFVAEMMTRADCAAIVAAVVGLGRSLGVDITAEGIETRDQLSMLRAAGCTQGRGYLISRPKPAAAIVEMLTVHDGVAGMAS